MSKIISQRKKAGILALVLGGCLYGNTALAANLVAAVPSDYSTGAQIGAVTGSRVTTHVDTTPLKAAVDNLNKDPAVFSINVNGQSMIFVRQYVGNTTNLKANSVLDADGNWNQPSQTGILNDVANAHGVTSNGQYVYATGYDLGNIGVAKIDGTELKEDRNKSINLRNELADKCGVTFGEKDGVHGEAVAVNGDNLYVLASVNPGGGADTYLDGFIMEYSIGDDGTLTFQNYARVGKNTDSGRINFYNNKIFVSSIGGKQNYAAGNEDTAIHVIENNGGQLNGNSYKIKVPSNVKCDFRDLRILPNGTALVMTYMLSGNGGGMDLHVYKTTVSNLMSDAPQNWEEIISKQQEVGWFGKINAEYYTKRLWTEIGSTLNVYTDGSTTPIVWEANDFGNNPQYYQFNSVAMLQPDTVTGETAKLTITNPEGLTNPSVTVEKIVNENATMLKGDYTDGITGTASDTKYADATSDNSKYTFNSDKVISLGVSKSGGALDTNILADVYARNGNDVEINAAGHTLQLQAKNYIGSPVGIYAGNGKNVTITADKLNVITAGYEGGNSLTNAIWNDAGKDAGSTITINAPVNISMSGGYGGNGIAVQKTDRWGEASTESNAESKITINGDVSIKGADSEEWGIPINSENVYSRFNNAGVLTSVDKSKVTINGNVDFTVYGNGASAVAKDSTITINGGSIKVPAGRNYGYYTLASYLGTINMNAGSDGTAPGKATVKLDGDIFALNTGAVNLGLTTADSYLNGVVDNGGTVKMWLQNGATWTNTANNTRYAEDNEDIGNNGISRITKLTGGSGTNTAGVIVQKADSKDLAIDNYSGYTTVLYNHDAAVPTTIFGGNVKVGSAASGSNIVLRTDYDNNMSTTEIQNNVLNALANKLYYNAYMTNEANLAGKVEIAEGLTAQSATKYVGSVAFNKTTGQGSLSTGNEPEPGQSVTEFTSTITGGTDKPYTDGGVKQTDGSYLFTKDTKLTLTSGNLMQPGYNSKININAAGKTLTGSVTGSNLLTGIYDTSSKGNVNIIADKVIFDINNDNSSFIQKAYGIWMNGEGSKVTINGLAEINTKAADLSYGINASNGSVQLDGLHLTVNKDAADARAMYVDGNAAVNVNVKDGAAGTNEVKIDGDIFSSSKTSDDGYTTPKNSTVNLALTTADSYLNGLSTYKYNQDSDYDSTTTVSHGTVNMWLQNGATWTNAKYGKAAYDSGFYGSGLTKLIGGSNAASAGVIFQKDSKDINVDNYSGYTTVLFSHDATTPTTINGGDIRIKSAAVGSSIALRTDYDTSMNTATVQNDVLNALANKLYYSAYTTGERNLSGKVEIAEGLTAQSAAKYVGDVAFDKDSGQGKYGNDEPQPPAEQTTTAFTTSLTGVKSNDAEYVNGGVLKDGSYAFTKDSTISVDDGDAADVNAGNKTVGAVLINGTDTVMNAAGKTLGVTATATDSNNQAVGIYANKKLTVTSDKLTVKSTAAGQKAVGVFVKDGGETTINGNVDINAKNTAGGSAYGVYANSGGSKLTINGDLTMKGSGDGDAAYGVSAAQKGGSGTTEYQAKGIYVDDSTGATVTITGKADLAVKGIGVDMSGSKNNKVTIASGTITTPESTEEQFAALNIAAGTFNMGMNNAVTDASGAGVVVRGNVYALADGTINLGLDGTDSSLTGVAVNNNGGAVNLYLKDGAVWNNASTSVLSSTAGSHVSKLAGGASAYSKGIVFQKDSNPLSVDNYSGYTTLLYGHDATTPTTIIGGDVKIGNAAAGSNITLRTDNVGLNTASALAADKNLVSATLNSLANKLYYTAYTTGERNLTGKVEIAEGLTAQSASMQVGDITYKTDNGQGQYEYTPAEDKPDTDAITKSITLTDDRLAVATEANAEAGKFVSALYSEASTTKSNPMVVDMNGHNLTLQATSDNRIPAALYAGANQYINITNDTKDKKLKISATIDDTRGANGIQVDGNTHLNISGAVEIDGVSTKGDSVNGIHIQSQDSEVNIGGPVTIKNISAKRERGAGMNASGIRVTGDNSKVTINDVVDITGVRGSSLATIGANTAISVQGGTITAAADADHTKKFYAARVEKGVINVNMDGDKAGSKTTKVTGDVYVTREYGKKVVEYSGGTLIDFDNKGVLNLALTDDQSYWTGVAGYSVDKSDYGTGGFTAHDIGTFNLYLQNGAIWNNEQQSSVSTTFGGSKVTSLIGGADSGHQGFIFQKDTNPLSVDNYSGYTTVIYGHDAAAPTTIIGGDVKINSAAAGSNITLRTDNAGLSTSSKLAADKNLVSETLNALANKLYYTAYTTGERNLTGKVEIAEGLTAQSASMKVGDITYKTENGQGQYAYTPAIDLPESQNKTEFSTAINGDVTSDSEYTNSGVRKDDGTYVFTKDETTMTPAKNLIVAGAWMPKISSAISGSTADKSVNIDLNNKNLTINTTTDTHTTGITAIGDGRVEINNVGKITVNAESTGGGQTAALFVNGGGHIYVHNGGENRDSKVLTLRADTTTKANGAVIKSTNGVSGKESTIVVDGLVDVLADGDMTDGKGANEAISAVASTIEIGGGSIKATNGAWCAIRAYGEFVSNNYGTVNVNIAKDSDGNVIGAGKNKTIIEGDFVTNGTMGTKGRISVGLSTADSYWKGNYTDVTGYGVTQGQLGNVNLFMSNGANWTGYTKGTMNVDMASGATWNGYNTGDNFSLKLSDNAVWYNTNATADASKVKYFNGSTGTAKSGYIDMTAAGTGNLVIDNYSGNATVLYSHDAVTPTKINGGDTTINHAEAASAITLRTDSSGIDLQDDVEVGSVLDALANKLYYTNYTTDERNLNGYVQIAEGLTTSSITKQTGSITFDGSTGKGTLDKTTVTPGVHYPDSQTTDSFTAAINSDWAVDKEYKKAGVLKTDGSFVFSKDKTTITTEKNLIAGGPHLPPISSAVSGSSADRTVKMDLNNKELVINTISNTHTTGITAINDGRVEINNAGKITVNAESTGGGQTAALFVNGGGQISIHNGGDNLDSKVLKLRADTTTKANGAVIKAMNGVDGKHSSIVIDGLVDIVADGDMTDGKGANEAISAVASNISVGGGTIRAINGANYAIRAYGELVSANTGTVDVNVSKDEAGNAVAAGNNKTVIEGDLATEGTMGKNGLINIGLGTADSSWTGNYTTDSGNVNLYMKDGATWTGYNTGTNFALDMKNGAKWVVTGDSTISSLNSGSNALRSLTAVKSTTSATNGGIVDMTNEKGGNVTIDNYSGSATFIYKHDAVTPTNIIGGNITIKHAGEDSSITLRTDRSGIDLSNSTLVDSVLNALAGKLDYSNYALADGLDSRSNAIGERNLSGYVQIAEGLTAASTGRSTGTISYSDTDGQATLKPGSVISSGSDVIYGSKETAMMRGAKSAMASSAMLWRSENADLMQRMGDLRLSGEEKGIWAKYYKGKSEYAEQNTDFATTYTAYQLGFDRQLANDWIVGAAVSYSDGSSSYDLGGNGDNSATSLSLYGTWQGKQGHYLDLLLKGSSIRNDYTVYNDFGHKLKGDYKTWGTSVSAEYGRHIETGNGFYVDPGVMFTLGRVQGKDYNAQSDFLDSKGIAKDMFVSQDGFNSAIGRLSLGIGQKTDTSNIFAKLALAHEFAGDFTTNYAADGEPTGNTEIGFGDTWYEMQLGGSAKLSNNSYAYATYEKTFNADLTNKWRVDAGLRWTF